jgi:hypothetical protein
MDQSKELLLEIRSCLDAHLKETLHPARSSRGLWHALVLFIAKNRAHTLLDKIQTIRDPGHAEPIMDEDENYGDIAIRIR